MGIVSLLTCKATTEALENNHATISASTIQKLLREYVENEIKGEFGRARRADFLRKREFWHSETMTELAGRIYDAWKEKMMQGFLADVEKVEIGRRGSVHRPVLLGHQNVASEMDMISEKSGDVF